MWTLNLLLQEGKGDREEPGEDMSGWLAIGNGTLERVGMIGSQATGNLFEEVITMSPAIGNDAPEAGSGFRGTGDKR